MFLSDPVLRAIAASTDDVWPEHLWRYDTANTDAAGDCARLLHTATLSFNDNAHLLYRTLRRVHDGTTALHDGMDAYAAITHPHGVDTDALRLVQHIERHNLLEGVLQGCYQAWRTHRPRPDTNGLRHLLVASRDPRYGVVTLRPHTEPGTWLVSADTVAAAKFAMRMPDRVIGQTTTTDTGYVPVAYTDPQHLTTTPHLVYRLPAADTERDACRAILRWWQLRYTPDWDSRTPDQLTAAELASLTA
jgi:hypothetical protein